MAFLCRRTGLATARCGRPVSAPVQRTVTVLPTAPSARCPDRELALCAGAPLGTGRGTRELTPGGRRPIRYRR